MPRLAVLSLAALFLSAGAYGADPATKQAAPAQPTASFVAMVVPANLFEVESSKLALERSRSSAVKAFAKHMIDDHSKGGVRIREALAQAGLSMPDERLDAKHIAKMQELRDAGDAFDSVYIEMQYKAHVEAVDLFKGYAAGGENKQLRGFAADVVPTLEAHLDQVAKMRSANAR
jgi:putative membrane protein